MGLFDSAKSLYDLAKDKASDVIGEEGMEVLKSIKDNAVEAGTQIKRATEDAVNNSDSEWVNKVKAFGDGIRREKSSERITIDTTDPNFADSKAKMIPAICTQCGAPLEVDPKWETAVCPHCDTPFLVSKGINQYNVEHANIKANTVQVHKKGTVEATLSYIEKRREEKREAERKEAERLAKLAAEKREKRRSWLKRNGLKTVLISLLSIIVLTVTITVSLSTSRKGKIGVGISSTELLKNNYSFAEQVLRQAGFSDITLLPDPDLVLGLFNSDGQVKSVSIASKTSFSSMSYFKPDDPIIITYHTYPSKENKEEAATESAPPPTNTPAKENESIYTPQDTSQFSHTEEVKEKSEPVSVANHAPYLHFGMDLENNSLEWIVVSEEENRVLLLSRYAIASLQFEEGHHENPVSLNWQDCSLRQWLNNAFLNAAFSSEDQQFILTSEIDSYDVDWISRRTDYTTYDKIFLLNREEFLLLDNADRKAKLIGEEKSTDWWLRNGAYDNYINYVKSDGTLYSYSSRELKEKTAGGWSGVRPAMWVQKSVLTTGFDYLDDQESKSSSIDSSNIETGFKSTTDSGAVYYSSNDLNTVKNGNTGVYAYWNDGSSFQIYYIIDFDEGFVYRFTQGTQDETCDRLKIEWGDLNSGIILNYHDGDDVWTNGLKFLYDNAPELLIVYDYDGSQFSFYPTNLQRAISIRDQKTIYDH